MGACDKLNVTSDPDFQPAMELPGYLKGRGLLYAGVVTLSLIAYFGFTSQYTLDPFAPLDEEDEWNIYNI